jgi:hypothetical protein
VKLNIKAVPHCGEDVLSRNAALSPAVPEPTGSGQLAVVGGGASVLDYLNELKEWPGEIWAINMTAQWLRANGIDCWFYSIDPSPDLVPMVSGKAILAEFCDPACFEAADDVRKGMGCIPGPTSAVGASYLGVKAGFSRVVFFGCDSSYGETTHVYRNEAVPDLARVSCGGESFLTKLEMILQAEQLAQVIKTFPEIYSERGGGFLHALVEHGDYDVTHVSPNILERTDG